MYISATTELEKKFKNKTHYKLLKDVATPEGVYLQDTIVAVEDISFAVKKEEDGSETVTIITQIRNFIPPTQEEKFFGSGVDPYGPSSRLEMSESEFSESFVSISELDREVKKYNRVLEEAVKADKERTNTMIFMVVIGFILLAFFSILYAVFFSDISITDTPARFTHTMIASFIVYAAVFFVLTIVRRSQYEKYKDLYDESVKNLEMYSDSGLTKVLDELNKEPKVNESN